MTLSPIRPQPRDERGGERLPSRVKPQTRAGRNAAIPA